MSCREALVETRSWVYGADNPVGLVHSLNVQEFAKIPLFMKQAPSEVDPRENPDLACLQSIIFDEERSPEGTFRDSRVRFCLHWIEVE